MLSRSNNDFLVPIKHLPDASGSDLDLVFETQELPFVPAPEEIRPGLGTEVSFPSQQVFLFVFPYVLDLSSPDQMELILGGLDAPLGIALDVLIQIEGLVLFPLFPLSELLCGLFLFPAKVVDQSIDFLIHLRSAEYRVHFAVDSLPAPTFFLPGLLGAVEGLLVHFAKTFQLFLGEMLSLFVLDVPEVVVVLE